jgi:ArsR family transcriptional regulator
LNIAPSTVSHHIKELRQAGVISVERRGKNIECWVNEEAVQALQELLKGSQIQGNLNQTADRRSMSG